MADNRLAHDTGRLEWGVWVCDCKPCQAILRANPDVLMIIKGSANRVQVNAGRLADCGADELLEEGSVREVFVAREQVR